MRYQLRYIRAPRARSSPVAMQNISRRRLKGTNPHYERGTGGQKPCFGAGRRHVCRGGPAGFGTKREVWVECDLDHMRHTRLTGYPGRPRVKPPPDDPTIRPREHAPVGRVCIEGGETGGKPAAGARSGQRGCKGPRSKTAPSGQAIPVPRRRRASLPPRSHGLVAQWESVRLTRGRSLVRTQPGPPQTPRGPPPFTAGQVPAISFLQAILHGSCVPVSGGHRPGRPEKRGTRERAGARSWLAQTGSRTHGVPGRRTRPVSRGRSVSISTSLQGSPPTT